MEKLSLSLKQLKEVFKEMGVQDVEVVEDDVQDFDANPFLETVDNSRSSILRPKWESEAGKKYQSEADGKALGSLVTAIVRETGLDAQMVKDAKTYPAMVKLLADHVKTSKKGDEPDVTKLLEEALKARDAEWEEKYNPVAQERDEWKNKYSQEERVRAWGSEFKSLPLNEKLDKSIAASDFDNYVNSQWDVKVQDGKIALFQKGTEIPAMNGSQTLKIPDIAKSFFEPRGNWVTSMSDKSAVEETNKRATGPAFVQPQSNPNLSIADQLRAGTQKAATEAGIMIPQ